MKTIQIPTNSNPFTVNINNQVYQYRAGETVEVPDEVAAAIEDALELEPKPEMYLSKFAQRVEGNISEITASDLNGIAAILQFAFYGCKELQSIVVPKGVKSIGQSAFRHCSNLTKVEIPENMSIIEDRVFENCTSLADVIVKASTPPSIQTDTFKGIPTTCVFEVPAESLEAYKTAEYWSSFANQIKEIEE